ncbi:YgjV family protein [Halomonas sp. WWR20]
MEDFSLRLIAGQAVSLVALALCIVAFASKRDDRLLVILIFANVAFALHFVLFESWVAAGLTALIVLRIILVRHFKGSWPMMLAILTASLAMAALTWQRPLDLLPLIATVLGTVGMFILRGIPMRLFLAGAALAWTLNNLFIGSIGGTLAEALILITNFVTIARLARDRRYTAVAQDSTSSS